MKDYIAYVDNAKEADDIAVDDKQQVELEQEDADEHCRSDRRLLASPGSEGVIMQDYGQSSRSKSTKLQNKNSEFDSHRQDMLDLGGLPQIPTKKISKDVLDAISPKSMSSSVLNKQSFQNEVNESQKRVKSPAANNRKDN